MIDLYLSHLDIYAAKKAIVVIIAFFSVIGLPFDAFRTQGGYSAIWLMILYCLGALAKKTNMFSTMKSSALIIMFLTLSVFSWGVLIVFDTNRLINYISPTILLNALILVVLFSRIKVKCPLITKLSPLAFGIYLFQLNSVIWNNILKDCMVFVTSKHVIVGIGYVFLFAFILFALGVIVEFLRKQIANALRISVLSQKIVDISAKIVAQVILLVR